MSNFGTPPQFKGDISPTDVCVKYNDARIPLSPQHHLVRCEYKRGLHITFSPLPPGQGVGAQRRSCVVFAPQWAKERYLTPLLPLLINKEAIIAFTLQDALLHRFICIIGQLSDFEASGDQQTTDIVFALKAVQAEAPETIVEIEPMTEDFSDLNFQQILKEKLL